MKRPLPRTKHGRGRTEGNRSKPSLTFNRPFRQYAYRSAMREADIESLLGDAFQLALWEYQRCGKFGFWLQVSCVIADELAALRGRREAGDA